MTKEIIQVQLAWFFESEYNESFEKISFKLKEKIGNSEQTQYIPVPNGAPSELPRLFLKYKDFNLTFSKTRADIYILKNHKEISTIENIRKITELIIDDLHIKVVRIGYVKSFFVEETLEYVKKMFKEEKIAGLDIKEIGFNLNVPKEIAGMKCNNIENLAMGNATKNGEVKNGLIINRDVNNIIGEKSDFDKTDKVITAIIAFDTEADNFLV